MSKDLVNVAAQIPQALKERLQELADADDRPLGVYIRRILQQFVAENDIK